MKRDFGKLENQVFDLAVVGGGIVGTGIARDASLRGIKTLLVDKEDYAYGTTSTSSRLIHGGFRYLRQLEFGLVRQDMKEREILLSTAPHLVHPLPFLMPITSFNDRVIMALGMRLYDILSYDKSLPSYHYYSKKKTLELEPGLAIPNLRGSYQFYDCQIPFAERLCIENVLSAVDQGAVVLNHAECTEILSEGNIISGIQVKDTLTGQSYTVSTGMVVNAAGPWMDIVHGKLNTKSMPMMRRTKGIHLVTPCISENAHVLFSNSDGRLFFVIPWEGYSLIGTTDTDFSEDSDTVAADVGDVDYLLKEVGRAFPGLKKDDVYYTFAGLRALAGSPDGSASNVTRGHRLIDHEKTDGLIGVMSVVGGKLTGYRAVAEETTDVISRKLNISKPCITAKTLLPGAPSLSIEEQALISKESGLPGETISHLHNLYGSRLKQIIEFTEREPQGKEQLCPHSRDIIAQIWHAVEVEQALTPADFLLRRSFTGMASCLGLDAIGTVVEEMGKVSGWNESEQKRQADEYRRYISLSQRFRYSNSGK
ncbi:MAG: glycerol-3-phosphate dehydrogenase/oxidase [Dehalococcoidales bacterium]|nr:MAG: glycerol-3-phosphate dehydrogenase/oxidase [Dehalococcoidales bacterium]